MAGKLHILREREEHVRAEDRFKVENGDAVRAGGGHESEETHPGLHGRCP